MEYRSVGSSSFKVSPLCIGTMVFWDNASGRAAQQFLIWGRTDPRYPYTGRMAPTS